MTGVRGAIRRDRKAWNDRVRDIGVVGREVVETISEGVTRLDRALRNDKRKLRGKTP